MDDDTFLGNSFEDEDNLPVVAIAPELSSDVVDIIDELQEPHIPSLLQKQWFANLNEVTNYKTFDPIPPQEHAIFWYSNKNNTCVVEWETTWEESFHQSDRLPACNVLSKITGPTRQTFSF